MENNKSKIKNLLKKGGFTINAPLSITPAIECQSLLTFENKIYDIIINVNYIYLKEGVPYVASDKYDEITLEDLQQESIKKIAFFLVENT